MSLQGHHGFDHLPTADLGRLFNVAHANATVTPTGALTGSHSLRIQGGICYVQKTVVNNDTYYTGMRIKVESVTNPSSIITYLDSATVQCDIRINAARQIYATRNGVTVAGPSVVALTLSQVYYLEFRCRVGDANGIVEVRLDGVTILNQTGIDTQETANVQINGIAFGCMQDGWVGLIDDVYYANRAAGQVTTFLGAQRVTTGYPVGDGANVGWSPSGGGTHYDKVDDPQATGLTDYVSAAGVASDTYVFSDVPGSATVRGVQVNILADKDDASAAQIAPVIRIGGVDYVGVAVSPLQNNLQVFSQVYETKPSDSTVWTAADVNNAEYGVRRTA